MGCHFLLQGIFPTQGLNSRLLHFRQSPASKWILYCWATKYWILSQGEWCLWESDGSSLLNKTDIAFLVHRKRSYIETWPPSKVQTKCLHWESVPSLTSLSGSGPTTNVPCSLNESLYWRLSSLNSIPTFILLLLTQSRLRSHSGDKKSEITQLYLTLSDPMDCSLPGSSIYGIFQARILEWVAISFTRRSSNPGIEPRSPILYADALPSELPGKSRW